MRAFYHRAEPRLDHPTLWFYDAKRQALADAFARTIREYRYTVWGCAILRNHAHLLVRRHRDPGRTVGTRFAENSRDTLRMLADIPTNHPVWSQRPYVVFLYTPQDVHRVVSYINANPVKERLSPQTWSFVHRYDNWSFRGHPAI